MEPQRTETESERPWGGDKLGFERPTLEGPASEQQQRVYDIITNARFAKRQAKRSIEARKEWSLDKIKYLVELDAIKRARRQYQQHGESEEFDLVDESFKESQRAEYTKLVELIVLAATTDEKAIAVRKDYLKKYHAEVGKDSGWNWEALKGQFTEGGFTVEPSAGFFGVFGLVEDVKVLLCQVSSGNLAPDASGPVGRLRRRDSVSGDDVLTQVGYEDRPIELRSRKDYILDSNGIPTRRFVTRGINYFQIAAMLGFKFDGKSLIKSSEPPGHYPRRDGTRFGNHDQTFKLGEAAVIDPNQWAGSRYTATGGGPEQPAETSGSERLKVTGYQASDMKSNTSRFSAMNLNEQSGLQVRNGSGPDQPMLSVTSVQPPIEGEQDRKLIRGNKGEPFEGSPESVATIRIDLQLAKREGVEFVNQHSIDSDKFKIAWTRWNELEKTVVHDPKSREVKRKARDELDDYIYSARKNREVTLTAVPNTIIVGIDFTPAIDRFGERFPVQDKNFIKWSDVPTDALVGFFNDRDLVDYQWLADLLKKEDGSYT